MNNKTNNNKNAQIVFLKDWFFKKSVRETYWDNHYCVVLKETEKAFQVEVFTNGSYDMKTWAPKSCCLMSVEEYSKAIEEAEAKQAEWEAKRQERWEAACKAYNDLIVYANAHGVKVRVGMRKETILRKMENAGVPMMAIA